MTKFKTRPEVLNILKSAQANSLPILARTLKRDYSLPEILSEIERGTKFGKSVYQLVEKAYDLLESTSSRQTRSGLKKKL